MSQVVLARKAAPVEKEQSSLRYSASELATLVRKVGVERFAFVCFDPAKHRSRWRMADFLGHPLLTEATVEHTAGPLHAAVASVRDKGTPCRAAAAAAIWVREVCRAAST